MAADSCAILLINCAHIISDDLLVQNKYSTSYVLRIIYATMCFLTVNALCYDETISLLGCMYAV